MQLPAWSSSLYFNYKKTLSIAFLAISNVKYEFKQRNVSKKRLQYLWQKRFRERNQQKPYFAFPNSTTALGYKDVSDKGLTLPIELISTYS